MKSTSNSMSVVKQEPVEVLEDASMAESEGILLMPELPLSLLPIIERNSVESNCCADEGLLCKKPKLENTESVYWCHGYLGPTIDTPELVLPVSQFTPPEAQLHFQPPPVYKINRSFWKAAECYSYRVGDPSSSSLSLSNGVDSNHTRVHPMFLHSNATSHKWPLGAIAELLDNALDEFSNGATFVNVDALKNPKDGSRMLLIEDNGGGMDLRKMRDCMSFGYSTKIKSEGVIGQYGNGFKTSAMRLGPDVIVFSRCLGVDGQSPTKTIGLLSSTYLTSTRKEDTVVPMLGYEKRGQDWKVITSCSVDRSENLETILQWSPYSSEEELLCQFNRMKDQGTCVIIYNLWENDEGNPELDFETDIHDIQIGGVDRDEKKIEMANRFPNSMHFFTYKHSLRSYASILYIRLPPGFRIILRGRDVEHHNLTNDLMFTQEVTYRPQASELQKDPNMVAVVTIGFVKDAKHHLDVQGFNVYHKNRLIKPFWRIWNPAGSNGRGVIGVLEANFVEPVHNKQGFEVTNVLSRLKARLLIMQKTYWSNNCHKIGYSCPKKNHVKPFPMAESPSPCIIPSHGHSRNFTLKRTEMNSHETRGFEHVNGYLAINRKTDYGHVTVKKENDETQQVKASNGVCDQPATQWQCEVGDLGPFYQLQVENDQLKKRLNETQSQCILLETRLKESEQKVKKLNSEQESLINIFSNEKARLNEEEERLRISLKSRDLTERFLRDKLKVSSNIIQGLTQKVRWLEQMRTMASCKLEP